MVVMFSYDPQGYVYLDDRAADAVSALADYLSAVEGGSARVEPSRVADDVYGLVSGLRSAVDMADHPFALALDDLMSAFDSGDGRSWVDALAGFLTRFEDSLHILRPLPGQPNLF